MRYPALALALCLVVSGSVADAAPRRGKATVTRKGTRPAKVAPPVDGEAPRIRSKAKRPARVEEDTASDDDEADEAPRIRSKAKHRAKVVRPAEVDVASDDGADDEDASAAPRSRSKAKHRLAIDARDEDDDDADAPPKARLSGSARNPSRSARERDEVESDDTADAPAKSDRGRKGFRTARASFDSEDAIAPEEIEIDVPVKVRKVATKRASDWHLAIGPYLWASSVDANVSLGGASVSSGVDFAQITHHARYGAELLAELRYRRFSIATDFMYGVVDLDGDKTVGPLMVNIHGTASSLLFDGTAGYMITGGDHSLLSIEGRAGVRYQRTSVDAAVGISGSDVASTEKVMAGADAIAGGRVLVRPFNRFYFSSTFDIGVVGSSSLTWSVAADASARLTSRLLLSVGWRTLTLEGAAVSMVMHGPRAAIQLTF
jgi:hypothetical protein